MPSELDNILLTALPAALLPVMGVDVQWQPQTGPQATVRGIFDQSEGRRSQADGRIAGGLWMMVADLPEGAAKMDTLTIDGAVYELRSDPRDHHDGGGGLWLYLRAR